MGANGANGANERVLGDPSAFAGTSEHSQQVALFAAVAQYENYFRSIASDELRSPVERSEAKRNEAALHWVHAVPNGGSRGSDKRSAMISGANMKAEGAKSGVYDIACHVARHGYVGFDIEMKKPGTIKREPNGSVRLDRSGNAMDGRSEEQRGYGEWLSSEGRLGAVFDSWSDALKALMWYLGFEHSLNWPLP
jgi:hypothetical protein